MLNFYKLSGQKGGFMSTEQPNHAGLVTLFANDLTHREADDLTDEFSIPRHLLSDVFDINELPRIELSNGSKYIFLRHPQMTAGKVVAWPILFVVRDRLFACISTKKPTASELVKPSDNHTKIKPDQLLNDGILAVAHQYEILIDDIGKRIYNIEKRMRSHEATNKDFFGFVTIEGNLNRSTVNLTGLLNVVQRLIENTEDASIKEILDDIQLFTKQLLVEANSHRHAITSIRNTYSTVANNTLNIRMKVLTFLTLLVALPNVFYGMYGMNIELPYMREPWAYPAIVGFTAVLIIIIYLYARRKHFF